MYFVVFRFDNFFCYYYFNECFVSYVFFCLIFLFSLFTQKLEMQQNFGKTGMLLSSFKNDSTSSQMSLLLRTCVCMHILYSHVFESSRLGRVWFIFLVRWFTQIKRLFVIKLELHYKGVVFFINVVF